MSAFHPKQTLENFFVNVLKEITATTDDALIACFRLDIDDISIALR